MAANGPVSASCPGTVPTPAAVVALYPATDLRAAWESTHAGIHGDLVER